MTTLAAEPEDRPAPEGEPPIEEQVEHLKAALRRMTSTALIPAGRVIYSGNIDQFALQLHDALRPADASGGGEGEPTCRDCGLTREQIDWGWHSAPYEGQFAESTPPAPTPASEDGLPYTLALTLRRLVHAWDDGLPVTDYVEALRSFVATTEQPALAASEMPKGMIGCDGQHESGSTFGCEDPAHCEVAEGAGLDGAWAAAETAPPEGWTLHTLRQFRSPLMRDPVWQAIAGPNGRYAASGEGETPAAALRALAARLATPAPEEAPE